MEEKVFIRNKKGLKLAAVIHSPKKNGKFPAVILLHGFTGYKEEPHIEVLAKVLAKNNFVAIRFDCSGFGESDGTIDEDFRFSNYLSDIDYIYDFLIKREHVDKNRIGIWGHSMGGMLSIIYPVKNQAIKAICSVSAPDSMWDTYLFKRDEWRKKGYLEKIFSKYGKLIRIPYSFLEDVKKYNVSDFVVKLDKPLFVVLGTTDQNVPFSHTLKIFKHAKEPKKLLKVKDMDHYYKNNEKLLKMVNKEVVDFFKENL